MQGIQVYILRRTKPGRKGARRSTPESERVCAAKNHGHTTFRRIQWLQYGENPIPSDKVFGVLRYDICGGDFAAVSTRRAETPQTQRSKFDTVPFTGCDLRACYISNREGAVMLPWRHVELI